MATFIPSQKGGQKLIYEGFLYQKHHRQCANGQMYWKCEQWRTGPCPGYAITDWQNSVTVTKQHNHGPSPNRVELAKIKSRIKQDASLSNLAPRALVNQHLAGISDQAKARLPKLANLEKSVSRKRRADGEQINPLREKKHCSIKMVGKKATLKLYYDIISPYSWVAFESLTRYERLLDVHLELLPVSIGFIMKETNNKPNVQQLPQKAIYMPRDLMLVGNYWGIPFRPPKDFFESLVKKASLNPLRFLTALSLYQPEHLRRASREFWLRAWSRDQPVYSVEDVEQVCTKLQIPDCQKLMESCSTEEVKSLLKRRTDEAIRSNAFGLPWIRVERQGQKDLFIWGSDRLPMLCELLGKPFVGPMREQNEIDEETREEKSKI